MNISHDTQQQILAFLSERVGDVSATTDLLAEGLLDSLLIMDLIAHLETSHQVRFENTHVSPRYFRTAGALAGLVEQLCGAQHAVG